MAIHCCIRTWLQGWVAMMLMLFAAGLSAADVPADHVRVQSVEVAMTPVGAVVLLKVDGKSIPVFVDPTVAESIHAALTKQRLTRPLSHDLMRSILQSYGGKVTQVVVTLKEATYYGALSIDLTGSTRVFDSRSSDAIALAAHFAAPIYVSRALLDKAGRALEEQPPASQRL